MLELTMPVQYVKGEWSAAGEILATKGIAHGIGPTAQ